MGYGAGDEHGCMGTQPGTQDPRVTPPGAREPGGEYPYPQRGKNNVFLPPRVPLNGRQQVSTGWTVGAWVGMKDAWAIVVPHRTIGRVGQ